MPISEPRESLSEHRDLADRILDAAGRLVLSVGARKLSLSDVATLAGVSRPTIYRYFVSKEELIDSLGARIRRRFDAAMERAMEGVTGLARWESAVDVVVAFLQDQPPGRQLDLDPGFSHGQTARALPMITQKLAVVLQQCVREDGFDRALSPQDLAGAVARVALSHYIFPDVDPAASRREIRAAAGFSGRTSRSDISIRRTR